MFYGGQRTEHKEIPPARERIKDFIRRSAPEKGENRPRTQGVSTRPVTQATSARPTTSESAVRFKSTADYNRASVPEFQTFFTTSAKVAHQTANRIEGKSSYGHYLPSDNMVEQQLEKMWYENISKDINEKRTLEEI